MNIAFCIPFSSVEIHRVNALDFIWKYLRRAYPQAQVLVGGGTHKIGDFPRGPARNALATQALSKPVDTFVFVDADSFVPSHQIDDAIVLAQERGWALPYTRYYNLTEASSASLLLTEKDDDDFTLDYEYVFPGPDPHDRPAAVGGVVVVTRKALQAVNGYDTGFKGWGYEDRAFVRALEVLVSPQSRIDGNLYHLWHPAPEDQRFGQPAIEHNRHLYSLYEQAHSPADMAALVSQG